MSQYPYTRLLFASLDVKSWLVQHFDVRKVVKSSEWLGYCAKDTPKFLRFKWLRRILYNPFLGQRLGRHLFALGIPNHWLDFRCCMRSDAIVSYLGLVCRQRLQAYDTVCRINIDFLDANKAIFNCLEGGTPPMHATP